MCSLRVTVCIPNSKSGCPLYEYAGQNCVYFFDITGVLHCLFLGFYCLYHAEEIEYW